MCDQCVVSVEDIVQQTRKLNVANTNRRRVRCRHQRQHVDINDNMSRIFCKSNKSRLWA